MSCCYNQKTCANNKQTRNPATHHMARALDPEYFPLNFSSHMSPRSSTQFSIYHAHQMHFKIHFIKILAYHNIPIRIPFKFKYPKHTRNTSLQYSYIHFIYATNMQFDCIDILYSYISK